MILKNVIITIACFDSVTGHSIFNFGFSNHTSKNFVVPPFLKTNELENTFLRLAYDVADYRKKTESLTLRLDKFVAQLIPLINQVHFQNAIFEEKSRDMEKEFWSIVNSYRMIFPRTKETVLQLVHAQILFETMKATKDHMAQIEYFNDPHHRLASDLFELHLLALTMLKRYGYPQLHTENIHKTSILYHRLHNLKTRMDFLSPFPEMFADVINTQFLRILKILKLLQEPHE